MTMRTTSTSESIPNSGATTIRFRIFGIVQGVGFRWWARRRALALGLVGSVRNERDGSVEVVAMGSEHALAAFRTELADGPEGAIVERVVEARAPGDDYIGFEILA